MITNAVLFSALIMNVVLRQSDYLDVHKCCLKGQLYNRFGDCIVPEGSKYDGTIINQTFTPPIDPKQVLWLPKTLRSRKIHVHYGLLVQNLVPVPVDTDEQIVQTFLSINNTARMFYLNPIKPPVIHTTVAKQVYCFEASQVTEHPLVIMTNVFLKFLSKCCNKGEELNLNGQCIARPGFSVNKTLFEINIDHKNNESYWLPDVLEGTFNVQYGTINGTVRNAVAIVNANESQFVGNNFRFKTLSPGGIAANAVARSFCIDSTSNPNISQVAVGLVVKVQKCCKKGEQLDFYERKCVKRPEHSVEDVLYGVVVPSQSYWLPSILGDAEMSVLYNTHNEHFEETAMLRAEEIDRWALEVSNEEEPSLSLITKTPTGQKRRTPMSDHCFDAISGGPFAPKVLMASVNCYGVQCIRKCCQRYNVMTKSGFCEPYTEAGWHPLNSSMAAFLDPDTAYEIGFQDIPFCEGHYQYLDFHPQQAPEILIKNLNFTVNVERFSVSYYCADYLQDGDTLKETLAHCEWPPYGHLYAKVWYLSAVAVGLLAIGIIAILSATQTRKSTHYRGMMCHAFCLLASNTGVAAFAFNGWESETCEYFAYTIYYFLLAAGFWLNVVSVNMTIGFRKPLGAVTRVGGGGGGGGGGGKWRRAVVLAHAYAWGVPAVLTAFVTAMNENQSAAWSAGIIKPAFFETKTCHFEVNFNRKIRRYFYDAELETGSLVYYYGPMGILVVANGVCLILTLLKIRALRKDSVFLEQASAQAAGKSTVPRTLTSTVLYVKLLLVTGVLELVLEATVWVSYQRKFKQVVGVVFYEPEQAFIFRIYSVILDTVRACVVCWLCVGRQQRNWLNKSQQLSRRLKKRLLGAIRHFSIRRRWSLEDSTSSGDAPTGITFTSVST